MDIQLADGLGAPVAPGEALVPVETVADRVERRLQIVVCDALRSFALPHATPCRCAAGDAHRPGGSACNTGGEKQRCEHPRVVLDARMLAALLLAAGIAGASAGAVRVASSASAWGGVREGKGPERVADYDLEATLDPVSHSLDGHERLTWRNRSTEPVRELYVHLYLNAFEGEETTFARERKRYGGFRSDTRTKRGEWGYIELRSVTQDGQAVSWTFVHPDGGPLTDRTVARFDLPRAVPPGGTAVLEIEFHDQLPRVVART